MPAVPTPSLIHSWDRWTHQYSHPVRPSSRSHLQDVEPGDGSGDHHPQRPPKQCGVSQVLSFLLPGFLRFHFLYQGLGHTWHGQMCPHIYVSFSPDEVVCSCLSVTLEPQRCLQSDVELIVFLLLPFVSPLLLPLNIFFFASALSSQLLWAGGFRRRLRGHHHPHNNLCAGRVSDQPDSPEPDRFCALRCCWQHGSHVGPQQVECVKGSC